MVESTTRFPRLGQIWPGIFHLFPLGTSSHWRNQLPCKKPVSLCLIDSAELQHRPAAPPAMGAGHNGSPVQLSLQMIAAQPMSEWETSSERCLGRLFLNFLPQNYEQNNGQLLSISVSLCPYTVSQGKFLTPDYSTTIKGVNCHHWVGSLLTSTCPECHSLKKCFLPLWATAKHGHTLLVMCRACKWHKLHLNESSRYWASIESLDLAEGLMVEFWVGLLEKDEQLLKLCWRRIEPSSWR